MSKIFENMSLGLDEILEEKLKLLAPDFSTYRILRKSVDARPRAPRWVYSVEVFGPSENPVTEEPEIRRVSVPVGLAPVLVVGAGPAGLFAALRLIERGIPCIILEQGSQATKRMKHIAEYWRYGTLNSKNNVCFGEGGAGLYSDGKLITRIKSPHIPYVLHRLVRFGAPEEILFLANPHVGSDRIRKVIPPLREFLEKNGAKFLFDTKVKEVLFSQSKVQGVVLEDGSTIKSEHVVLATGHSATDIIHHLHDQGVAMEGKSFAIGFRIEHPQKLIDRIQYRDYAGHPALGAANYRLADHDAKSGVGVYSFCMCPGGYVISSGTEDDSVVTNGMSNYKRNSPFANAAVVISIDHANAFGSDLFGGLGFRRELELRARSLVTSAGATKQIPSQRVIDFLERKAGPVSPGSTPSGVVAGRLDTLISEEWHQRLSRSLETFHRQMKGFISPEAVFHGVESRTSCPVRIVRDDDTLESTSHAGLYPTGEGAGYAGGITSAAVDGVRVAEAIAAHFA